MKRTPTPQTIALFTPIESMNPLYLGNSDSLYEEVLEKQGGNTRAEIKEDGYRLQIHKKGEEIRGYTRSLNSVEMRLFPELTKSLSKLPDCILDSELTGAKGVGHQGFQAVQKRFRHKIDEQGLESYLISSRLSEHPLHLKVFDTLYWEGASLLDLPLRERRSFTERVDLTNVNPSTQYNIKSSGELQGLFQKLVNQQYEGLVCKRPDSLYLPGKRTNDWIKLKRAETYDLAVLGVYLTTGKLSSILCGTRNSEGNYETLTKVNARSEGLDAVLFPLLQRHFVTTVPTQLILHDHIPDKDVPDYFIHPARSQLVEVGAMNICYSDNWQSCGRGDGKAYALRMAVLYRVREDKRIDACMTTEQIRERYIAEQ